MKKIVLSVILSIFLFSLPGWSQEKYGKTFNLGIGATYYGYVGHSTPVVMLNYEIDVVKNFTLAPFVGFYSYTNYYYWNGFGYYHDNRYKNDYYYYNKYSYRQTVIPLGVKGTYYFDDLLNAPKKWDFYAALSLGFAIRSTTWSDGYYRNEAYARNSSVYADLHFGTEYHINDTFGAYADLSLGMFLLGLAIHH